MPAQVLVSHHGIAYTMKMNKLQLRATICMTLTSIMSKEPDTAKYPFCSSFYINFINSQNESILLEIRIVVTFGIEGIRNGHKVEGGPQWCRSCSVSRSGCCLHRCVQFVKIH